MHYFFPGLLSAPDFRHSHRAPRALLLHITVLSITGLAGSVAHAQDSQILVAGLRQRLSALQTLDIAYTFNSRPTEYSTKEGLPVFPVDNQHVSWVWSPHKERFLSTGAFRVDWSYDGTRMTETVYDVGGQSISSVTQRPRPTKELMRQVVYAIALGLRSPYSSKSLPELLSSTAMSFRGTEVLGEKRCPVLASSEQLPTGESLSLRVAFDPSLLGAPVKLEYALEGVPGLGKPEWAPRMQLIMSDFRLSTKTFLPHRVEVAGPFETVAIDVLSAKENQPIPAEVFAVNLPDGITLTQFGADPKQRPVRTITGGLPAAERRLDEIKTAANEELRRFRSTGSVYDARPRYGSAWSILLWSLAAGCSLIGGWILLRRRRQF